MEKFANLFSPLKIGPVEVKNRFYSTPHGSGFIDILEDEYNVQYCLPGERLGYYLAEKAKGGTGLVFIDTVTYHPSGLYTAGSRLCSGYIKEIIPRYRMIADMVHAQGAKLFVQLVHGGHNAQPHATTTDPVEVWTASVTDGLFMYSSYGANYGMPKAMEKEDIEELLSTLAQSAKNAKEGGLDGVEYHACHAYFAGSFLSPLTNKRTDEYGGSMENRMRLLMRCVDVIREAVGSSLAFGVRISGDEFTPGSITIEDSKIISKALEDTGKVDYISVSGGSNWTIEGTACIAAPSFVPPGFLVPHAAEIKRTVSIPVFCAARINEPVLAEKILAEGQADMIGMGRPLIADPELPKKALEGRTEEIRACVACLAGCMSRFLRGQAITCIHNPAAGREKRFGSGTLKAAEKKKKVMVIGGGPAGLKAAEISAHRGHEVVLYEKESQLGGQVRLAALTPAQQEFGGITDYLIKQVEKLGVKTNLGQEATVDTVNAEKPDVVVVATGCEPVQTVFNHEKFAVESIKGVDQKNVVSVWDVLQGKVDVGQNVVFVDGEGHYRTLAVVDYLAQQGKKVQVLAFSRNTISDVINTVDQYYMYRRFREKGVKFTPSVRIKEISGNSITIRAGGQTQVIEGIDTIVWAVGAKANDSLYFDLKGKVKELYRVGDCLAPRFVESAIWEGEMVGRKI